MGWFFVFPPRGNSLLKDMRTQTHLKPGQKGTKSLVEKYGNSLLCVRYRYDEIRGVRLKTVEIVVDEKSYKPPLRYRDEDVVAVIVSFTENVLRDKLKVAGGRWDPEKKVWHVLYGSIRGDTGLEERILPD